MMRLNPATGIVIDSVAAAFIETHRRKIVGDVHPRGWQILWHAQLYLTGQKWLSGFHVNCETIAHSEEKYND